MNKYIVYDSSDNSVVLDGVGHISTVDPLVFGPTMVAKIYDGPLGYADLFVNEVGEICQRQSMPLVTANYSLIANGTDESVITGIPAGAQVEWPDGQTDIVTDGEIRFSVDLPGTYTFRFTAVPYLDQEVVIEAIPAT